MDLVRKVPPIAGDEAEFRKVLISLIFNAVDTIRNGGALTLRTRVDDNHVVLEVNDTGGGMTEETR